MKIIKTKRYLLVAISFLFLVTFCKNSEDEKKQYEGFSNLVQERREANKQYKKESTDSQKSQQSLKNNKNSDIGKTSGIKKRDNSPVDIVVKNVANGDVIVYGTAFFDENGKLINIKITQD